jgi:hypothetical protein
MQVLKLAESDERRTVVASTSSRRTNPGESRDGGNYGDNPCARQIRITGGGKATNLCGAL